MKRRQLILAVLLMLSLGLRTSQYAQDVPSDTKKSDQAKYQFALSLLRAINTAEVVDHTQYGSFSSWQNLLSHHSDYFNDFIAMHRQQLPKARFVALPEIVDGWNLRLTVHADGQGYDLLLRDITDTKCGYAVLTDEQGII